MATNAMQVSHTEAGRDMGSKDQVPRAYTMKMAITMGLYASLFFVLAFCGPYVLPAITLLTDAPLDDRKLAASQLLLLSDTVWVAIPVLVLGAMLFSMLATRRAADALERIGRSGHAWASGRTAHRLHFRNSDSLDDLAKVLNHGWIQVGQGIETVQQEVVRGRTALDGVARGLSTPGASTHDVLPQLQMVTASLDRIQAAVRQFDISQK